MAISTFKLAEIARIAKVSKRSIAEEAGYSEQYVGQVLNGQKQSEKVDAVARQLIARALLDGRSVIC